MMSPHPPRFRMNRRKTVSVTPAMGARTVAGAIFTVPIMSEEGTSVSLAFVLASARARTLAPTSPELSQNLRTNLFYCLSANRIYATIRASRGDRNEKDSRGIIESAHWSNYDRFRSCPGNIQFCKRLGPVRTHLLERERASEN